MVVLDSFTPILSSPLHPESDFHHGGMAHPAFPGPFPIFFHTGNNNNKTLMCLIPPGPLFLRRHRLTQLLCVSPTHSQPANPVNSLHIIAKIQQLFHYYLIQAIFISCPDYDNSLLSQVAWYMKDGREFTVLFSTPLHVALASECFSQLHIDGAMLCQALRGLAASASCLPEPSPHAK